MELVISKHLELKANVSLRKFIDEAKKIVDGQILNEITHKVIMVKVQPTQKMKSIIEELAQPH
jgi:hypothetical protein